MTSLFISYSRKDIEIARRLSEAFKSQGLDFWIDWEGIPPTVDWWKEIEKGIEEADIFLFLISPDSANPKSAHRKLMQPSKTASGSFPSLCVRSSGRIHRLNLGILTISSLAGTMISIPL